jgi:hypothetical protein
VDEIIEEEEEEEGHETSSNDNESEENYRMQFRHGKCKTSDFRRKHKSLYHRDSPWISGYRVQNVSQINTQSHTSHHIRVQVHNLLHVHYGVHQYKPLG